MTTTEEFSNNPLKAQSFKTATGTIEFTLKSDIVFHYALQKSKKALTGLVCALNGISPSKVSDIVVLNPIDLNNLSKETVMDLKLLLNDGVIINIELQMYTDSFWVPRSLLYLCRGYDSISEGDNYSMLKPAFHYCITDQNLINDEPEFYSKYRLLNVRNHNPYTKNFGINVLNLHYTDLATPEDIDNNLVYWSNLFKATTWDEIRALTDEHSDLQEVAELIYEMNTDAQTKEILEGQRRYREQLATQYAAGQIDTEKKYKAIIEEKDATIAELLAEIDTLKNNK
ncbi:PD-(D/E)XK nuclease family transposase [Butyrivibrio sp. YAB3001]|uniref:PD-(D/E)XK nuclease family transposase n=1 Tax=Butyrivibrio sp. YAB3001 TaxID=1520812 RepID=UPI0008F67052|nr:PD-(D/E)XK nuclease family transposase [Butyrivibrio sp. YAB3001]SFC51142.1 conserved hypothetical protein (putative transposase or invertase) [Butyrivibrio sp. YAB3001]